MQLFKSHAKPATKADMLYKMRVDIEAAVARANKYGIDSREIATTLEAQADYYRQRDAMFRSVL
jgi:hypothetical protein